MFTDKSRYILIHLAGIAAFMLLPCFFHMNGPHRSPFFEPLQSGWYWFFCLFYIAVFYLNAYLLLPAWYFRKKYLLYFAAAAALLLAAYFARPFDHLISMKPPPDMMMQHHGAPPPGNRRFDVTSLFLLVITIGLSSVIQYSRQWQLARQQYLEAAAEKANAELSFLKAQVNPHFLYNTLNNIYSLAAAKDGRTPAAIMQLSNIMRHITDDAVQDFVPLEKEISFVNDLVELHRMRLGSKATLEYTVTGNAAGMQTAPLLFSTFIENAFKYGTSNSEPASIVISIEILKDGIVFRCRNKLFARRQLPERQGTGIANARKRLNHLYPGRHDLYITENDGYYSVQLSLLS